MPLASSARLTLEYDKVHYFADAVTTRAPSIPPRPSTPPYPVAPVELSGDGADTQRSQIDAAIVDALRMVVSEQKLHLQLHCSKIEESLASALSKHEDVVRSMMTSSDTDHHRSRKGSAFNLDATRTTKSDMSEVKGTRSGSRGNSKPSSDQSAEAYINAKARKTEMLFQMVNPRRTTRFQGSAELDVFFDTVTKQRLPCTWLKKVAEGKIFNGIVVALIVSNALFNGILADLALKKAIIRHEGQHGSTYGGDSLNAYDPEWESPIEVAFCIAFTVELVIRILAFEGAFLIGHEWKWNAMDTVLVITSIADMTLTASGLAWSQVRTLRIMRITRVLRLMRFSTTIQLMLLSALNSALPFVCALFFISVLIFLFATVMVHGVIGYITDNASYDLKTATAVLRFFDSVPKALLSLFMIFSGGVSWVEIAEPFLEISIGYVLFLVAYVAVMVLTVLNIVTAIFVSDAVETAKRNREIATESEMKRTQAAATEFLCVFSELDQDHSSTITEEEFLNCMNVQEYKHFFAAMGVDVTNAQNVFQLLDIDGSGELECEEFVVGLMELKGGGDSCDHAKAHEGKQEAYAQVEKRLCTS